MRKLLFILALFFTLREQTREANAQVRNSSNVTGMRVLGAAVAEQFGKWEMAVKSTIPAAGVATVELETSTVVAPDGSRFNPFNTHTPLLISDVAGSETVTPSAVSCSSGAATCTFTATFSLAHPYRFTVKSGTYGLQEAVDYMSLFNGGGEVLVTPDYRGTTSMIQNATGSSTLMIVDTRAGQHDYYTWQNPGYQVVFGVSTAASLSGFAPLGATYITQTSNGTLSSEQALSSLTANKLLRNTAGGVLAASLITDDGSSLTLGGTSITLSATSLALSATTVTLSGTTSLALSATTVTLSGTLSSSILPTTTNQHDLGSASLAWRKTFTRNMVIGDATNYINFGTVYAYSSDNVYETNATPVNTYLRRANGSIGSRTNVTNGDYIGQIIAAPYCAGSGASCSAGQYPNTASISFAVDGAVTNGEIPPVRTEFYTQASGAISPSLALTLDAAQAATFANRVNAKTIMLNDATAGIMVSSLGVDAATPVARSIQVESDVINAQIYARTSSSAGSYPFGSHIVAQKSRGFNGGHSRTNVQNGDYLGSFDWQAYSNSFFTNSARISASVDDVVVAGQAPATRIEFYTNPNNTNGVLALTIDSAQTVTVASALNIATGGSTTISTGAGSVKMSTANPANNAVWIPIKYDGTTYYVPGWTTNAP